MVFGSEDNGETEREDLVLLWLATSLQMTHQIVRIDQYNHLITLSRVLILKYIRYEHFNPILYIYITHTENNK